MENVLAPSLQESNPAVAVRYDTRKQSEEKYDSVVQFRSRAIKTTNPETSSAEVHVINQKPIDKVVSHIEWSQLTKVNRLGSIMLSRNCRISRNHSSAVSLVRLARHLQLRYRSSELSRLTLFYEMTQRNIWDANYHHIR